MSFWKELKQPTIFFFVLGIIFFIIGGYLWGRSESPIPDFITGTRQERWAIICGGLGLVSWLIMFVTGNSKKM